MKYVVVAGLYNTKKRVMEICFDWIIQKPKWPDTVPNSLLSGIENALTFDDPQSAREYAKAFGKGSVMSYHVFTVENAILHQVMDS